LYSKIFPYRSVKTIPLGYKNQSVIVGQGNSDCWLWDPYKTNEYIM